MSFNLQGRGVLETKFSRHTKLHCIWRFPFYPNTPNQLTLKTRLERVIENDLFHIFLYNKIRNSGPLNFQAYDIKLVLCHYPAHRMCSAISIAQINVYSTESESRIGGSQIHLVQSFYLNSQMLQTSD